MVILTEVQDSSYSTGYFVFKINQQGDTLWSSLLQTDNYEQAYSIEAKDEGFILGGLRRIPDNSMVGHHSKNLLIKLDSLGNKEWERFIPPEELSLFGVKDFILEGDGSIIIGTSIGIPQTFSSDYVNAWEPMICKLDSDLNLIWSRPFIQYHRWQNSFNKLLKCKDSSGYLGCGLSSDPTPNEPGGDINGFILKASNDGDSLWRNSFHNDDWWEYDNSMDTWKQLRRIGESNKRSSGVGFSIGDRGYLGIGQSVDAREDWWIYLPD